MAYRQTAFGRSGKGRGQYGRGSSSSRGGGSGRGSFQGDAYEDQPAKVYAAKVDQHMSKQYLRSYVGETGPFFLSGAALNQKIS